MPGAPPSLRAHVLLVEDDPDLREWLATSLEADGFGITTAGEGSTALDRLRDLATPPDVIVLDLMLPGMDGWEFRIEQKKRPPIADIPVVALSADDSPKAVAIDAAYYLKKPIRYPALRDAIDATVRRARLSHADRLASLGRLSAGIAHEINNPLTYVVANLTLARALLSSLVESARAAQTEDELRRVEHDRAKIEEMIGTALVGADRIRTIVRGVKVFARPDDERRRAVDPRSVLEASVQMAFGHLRDRARVTTSLEAVPMVLANEGSLGQVFLNLLMNAAQAISGDPTENEVRVRIHSVDGATVLVEVKDTGSGMPPEVREHIFEPFFTTKPVGSGTGLGLALCHGIVTSLGGRIEVESEVGKGSTFRVVLPAARTSGTQPMARVSDRPPGPRLRVLVVDDEESIARTLVLMLGRRHDCEGVTTPEDALARLRADHFDLVLCDVHMPRMNGIELYERVRTEQPGAERAFVFMSGGAFDGEMRAFLEAIPNPFVEKPFGAERIEQIIEEVRVAKTALPAPRPPRCAIRDGDASNGTGRSGGAEGGISADLGPSALAAAALGQRIGRHRSLRPPLLRSSLSISNARQPAQTLGAVTARCRRCSGARRRRSCPSSPCSSSR